MASTKEHLHQLIDELPDSELPAVERFLEFVRYESHQQSKETEEDRAWLEAGAEDAARWLEEIEAELPPEELSAYLDEVNQRARPVRWNQDRHEFEEVRE